MTLRTMKTLTTTVLLAAVTTTSQATLVISNGGTLLEENFNAATSFSSLQNAAWVPGGASYPGDDYLRLAPGITADTSSASLSFTTAVTGTLDIGFYYGFQAGTAIRAWLELDGEEFTLPHTSIGQPGFALLNPGSDNTGANGSGLDVLYSRSIANVTAGQHTLRFATAGGTSSDFRVDDLRLSVGSVSTVPEPQSWMLWLLGLGLIAVTGKTRKRRNPAST